MDRKPLNFAQALRSKPAPQEVESTVPDSQLSTTSDSQLSTVPASQRPPASQLSTTIPAPASKLSTKRKVAIHRRRKVDSRKGDRHSTDKVPFNTRLGEATVNRIKHFCVNRNLEQQEFAELAAIHFMDSVESHQPEEVDSMLALDDRDMMIIFKTSPAIINLYLQYNPENRWKPADDYEGRRYNGKDIRLVEVGIIQTQFNARFKKINSFKYYTTEIDIAFETPLQEETIEIMLKHGRKRWEDARQAR